MNDAGYSGKQSDSPSDYRESINDELWEDDSPTEYDFKDIFSGARQMINSFEGGSKVITKAEKYVSKLTRALDKKLKEYDKFANDAAKNAKAKEKTYGKGIEWSASGKDIDNGADKWTDQNTAAQWVDNNSAAGKKYHDKWNNSRGKGDYSDDKVGKEKFAFDVLSENASHEYDMAVVFNDAVLINANVNLEALKEYYKQLKAVFMKAVTVSDKKLEESSIYAQAVAEAAEDEVEDVITKELSKHDNWLSSTSNAPETVLDPGVGGYELGYEPDKWTDDYITPPTAGSKDSTIVGTSESAYFGSLLY